MRAGRLDRLIDIQRATATLSDSGEPQETWANLVARRPASYRPMNGGESYGPPQLTASQQVEFRIRYSSTVADLSPKDRVIYPAVNEGDTPPEARIFDILSVNEIGRREGLQIVAKRHADGATT